MKLDNTLKTPEERLEYVSNLTSLTPRQLTLCADYILSANTSLQKANGELTPNRLSTIHRRETSYEGLVSKFEAGEDALQPFIKQDKNLILDPRISITPEDLKEIPGLSTLQETITSLKSQLQQARGTSRAYTLKQTIIQMCQEQYILKMLWRQPIPSHPTLAFAPTISSNIEDTVQNDTIKMAPGINLMNPAHVSLLLNNYSSLKEDSYFDLNGDMHWILIDLENLIDKYVKSNQRYFDILVYKIDGLTNEDIARTLRGTATGISYISTIWRHKIPKLIAEGATREFLTWYFTMKERGKWKRCSRCGEYKLAHPLFFPRNKTSKDGYYSICKMCRGNRLSNNT